MFKKELSPWYIVGFVEGEGCFAITISKHKTKKLGKDARLIFEIELRGDDKPILEKIKDYFDCGYLVDLNYQRYGWMPHTKYAVHSFIEIKKIIIPFFKKYNLKGKKKKDFILFCEAARIFSKGGHLTEKGIEELKVIRSQMNEHRQFGK
ncbi:MAG TPA: LAGLIDADG family homing endonuclease [Candidatus Woesebacteria bacterium]|nr:LAGLIDADG family homing endonuclease [Candidatus Woesebacteria bacterium]